MFLLILIVFICLVNMILLIKHMKDMRHKEPYEVDPTSTRVGPYEGRTFCTGIGIRTKVMHREEPENHLYG